MHPILIVHIHRGLFDGGYGKPAFGLFMVNSDVLESGSGQVSFDFVRSVGMLSDFGLQDQLYNNPAVYSNEPGAKDVTTAKTCGRKYIRNSGYGGSTRTAFQSSVKAVFKQLSQAWQGLTNE